MRINYKDILIVSGLQKNPYHSIRELSKEFKLRKDSVFRTLKKFRSGFLFKSDYMVNYCKVGLKPLFMFLKTSYQKINKALSIVKNPYLLEASLSAAGTGIFILAKYVYPADFNMNPILGMARSWNWITESYMLPIIYEGYNYSFHYFNVSNQSWDVNWLYWGLMIKEVLINKRVSEVLPPTNIIEYGETPSHGEAIKCIELLIEIIREPELPVSKFADKLKIDATEIYRAKKLLIETGVLKKYFKINPLLIDLKEDVAIVIQTSDETVISGLLNGLILLPVCRYYRVRGQLEGLIVFVSLPYGGLSKILHIFSEYLFDKVEDFWLLPTIKVLRFDKLPSINLLDKSLKWINLTLVKNKKAVLYEDYSKIFDLPDRDMEVFG